MNKYSNMHILLEYRGKSENDQSSDVKTCKQTELQFKRCMFQFKKFISKIHSTSVFLFTISIIIVLFAELRFMIDLSSEYNKNTNNNNKKLTHQKM